MKSVLVSKKPKIVVNVLNGDASILIFKKFPKEYKGWVYIYCTKDKENELLKGYKVYDREEIKYIAQGGMLTLSDFLNGKVVARFYCDKVEETMWIENEWHGTKTLTWAELLDKSCLDYKEITKYLNGKGYAIHISQLEIFHKPKELDEFVRWYPYYKRPYEPLTKAPKNYQWIEV